jgi:predicted O-methyltransferase YrrM
MIKILREYINYKLNAKGRHGVHSPFVYDLLDKCLRKNVPQSVYKRFISYKKQLNRDESYIDVTDLGAGSKKLSKRRKIKKIARISGSSSKYGKLLFKLVQHYKPKTILELGTSLGVGTFMLANGNPNSKVITLEGCAETSSVSKKMHLEYQTKNVDFVVSDFITYLRNYEGPNFDFIFIDGDHRGEKLLELLNILDNHIHQESIILLDDIRWNSDMLTAWNQIVSDNRYHLSIDLFRMGIIMLRHHQEKEHFVIRY